MQRRVLLALSALGAALVGLVASVTPAHADSLSQTITVTRPAGQLVIDVRGSHVVVTDTRADDPGWNVAGVTSIESVTPAFTDGSGFTYGQRVALHDGTASAPAHHGLGIAFLKLSSDGPTVTITVI
ncbi:MAG TPA: hypothetical protein VHC63_05400 [Acidimicrobiales bacterium]|nr:hypothetical protein [Acidimicrobiales bacterium]